jgi:ubiquinone biosynthesis protein UbiJ
MLGSALEAGINRLLALDDQSTERIRRLRNRVLQLDLEGMNITLYFSFTGEEKSDGVSVSLECSEEPDTVISGSPAALFAMAAPDEDGLWGVPGSPVKISGDATLARDLERLFSRLDPDWEGPLARVFGDVLGYQMASGIRESVSRARDVAEAGSGMVQDYLKRQTDLIVPRAEFESFADAVDEARDAVDRFEARLRSLES